MISYDYRDEIAELYKDYNIKTITMKYSGATKEARSTERKEYIIMNYEPVSQIGMFEEK
jgi:hypothetical protein